MKRLLLAFLFLGMADHVLAAPCPPPTPETVCVTWTEPVTTNLKQAVLTFFKNGIEQPAIVIPASAPSGGGVQTVSFPTMPCEKAIYAGSGHNEYLSGATSDEVPVLPETGLVKDRMGECFQVLIKTLSNSKVELTCLSGLRPVQQLDRSGLKRIVTCEP